MNGFLLDTNVLSALRRPAENRALVDFIKVQPADYLHSCDVIFAEIRCGIELQPDPAKRIDLFAWLDHSLRPLFEDRVHAVTEDVLLKWLLINREGREHGHSYAQQNSLIAAIAATMRLVVVSRDETHFLRAGVPVLDPWHSCFYDADRNRHEITNLVSATLLAELPD